MAVGTRTRVRAALRMRVAMTVAWKNNTEGSRDMVSRGARIAWSKGPLFR